MAIYYDAIQIIQRGTEIISYECGKKPSVREGEILVGILSNGLWAVAPDITSDSEFNAFYKSYSQGQWLEIGIYTLPKKEIENCQDKGKVNADDLEKIISQKRAKENGGKI